MTKLLSLFFISIFLFSCGRSADERRNDAVLSANILLTNKECQKAIDLLESVGRDSNNGKYMQVLASAYACKTGYSELTFFVDDMPLISSVPGSTLGGLARFALSSSMTSYDSPNFVNLQSAIDILLYAGGISSTTNPTAALRAQGLNALDAQDLNAQLMYMLLTQMGMYLRHYGNASATGVKGTGTELDANKCLVNYDMTLTVTYPGYAGVPLGTFLDTTGGACDSAQDGHSELGAEGNLNVARLCQGVVLFNNFIDVFPIVLASATSADLNDIAAITTLVDDTRKKLITAMPALGAVATVTNQAKCETDNAASTDYLQIYMAVIYETLFQ